MKTVVWLMVLIVEPRAACVLLSGWRHDAADKGWPGHPVPASHVLRRCLLMLVHDGTAGRRP